MKINKKFKKAFTLVELVVVIAVVAILAAVSVGAYFGVTDSANSSNATQAQKAYKDLWLTYSLATDFDISRSANDNAMDFCMEYAPYNGPQYDINYKIVSINDGQVDDEQVQGKRRPMNQSNGNDIACDDAILFIVETEYPSWFVVCGQYIIETGPICKNQNELIKSLKNSSRIKSGTINDDFKPEIEVVGKDEEGNPVRGHKYFKYSINVPALNAAEAYVDELYLKHGETLSINTPYVDAYSEVDGGGQTLNFRLMYEDDELGYIEYDKTQVIDLSGDYVVNESNLIKEEGFGKYDYFVESQELDYVNLAGLEVNLTNYPICLVTGQVIETNEAIANYEESVSNTEKWVFYDIVGKNYSISNFTNKYYSDFETFYENYKNQKIDNDSVNLSYIFIGKDVKIDESYDLGNNVVIVLPKEAMTNQKMNDMYISNYEIVPEQTGMKQKYIRYSYIVGYTDWKKSGSAVQYSKSGSVTIKDNMYKDRDLIDPVKTEYSGKVFSSMTIAENKSLTLGKNSIILVDGVLAANGSNYTYRCTSTDRGELTNNGTINIKDGDLISYGPIYGSGEINVKGNSEVVELIKIDDFGGGNLTASCALKDIAYMPFLDYVLDGIQCKVNFYPGSSLKAYGGINTGSGNTKIQNFYIIAPSGNTLFKNESLLNDLSNENDLVVSKSVILDKENSFNHKQKIQVSKTLSDGECKITVAADLPLLGTTNIDLKSSKMYFAISNFEIVIENGGYLDLSNGTNRYQILPSTKVEIKEGGTIRIGGNVSAVILSASNFDYVVERVTASGWKANMVTSYKNLAALNDGGEEVLQLINNGSIIVEDKAQFCADQSVRYEAKEFGTYTNNSSNTSNYTYEFLVNNGTLSVTPETLNISQFTYVPYEVPQA